MNDNDRLARAIFGNPQIDRQTREGYSERMAYAHARLWYFYFHGEYHPNESQAIIKAMQRAYALAGGQPTFDEMQSQGKLDRMYSEGKV